MDQNIGKRLDGRYEITELIGIGGMADVYKAMDIMENKVVAIKILKTEYASNEEFLRRFRNESKAIAVLSHPNIVKIYDVGFTEQIQYIVMEYIDGITLKEYIEQQTVLKWKEVIYFTIQILRALQHAHDRGIVHRDIKPQNIMLFTDGTIKVMDFGIARFARQTGKTLSDKTIGSVHYISPEQARGDLTDEKSDIYSVGAMVYEMVTGKKPFEAETPVAVALMHMQDKVLKPTEIQPSIPKGFEEIILRAMQKDPEKRYQSASAMIKDIEIIKANTSATFGYDARDLSNKNEDSTIYFKPLSKKQGRENMDTQDEYDEDEVEASKPSVIIGMLLAVTIAVVVIASIFIGVFMFKGFDSEATDRSMPSVVGMEYFEAQNKYRDIKFVVSQENSSEYPEGYIISQGKPEGRSIKKDQEVKIVVSLGPKMEEIPDVVNWSYDDAREKLERLGFKVVETRNFDENIVEGHVVSVDPDEHTSLAVGSQVVVVVSSGPVSREVTVPGVVGLNRDEAFLLLRNNKLTPTEVRVNTLDDEGTVLSQEYQAGEIIESGTSINIYVSTGHLNEGEIPLTINIPHLKNGDEIQKYQGGFTIEAFIDGASVGIRHYDEVDSINSTILGIKGNGTQTVYVQVKSDLTNRSEHLSDYIVDFSTGEFKESDEYDFNMYAFYDAEKGGF